MHTLLHRRWMCGLAAMVATLCLAVPVTVHAQQDRPPAAAPPPQATDEQAKPGQQASKPDQATVPPADDAAQHAPGEKATAQTAKAPHQSDEGGGLPAMGRALIGKPIYGPNGENIAEVKDLVVANGKLQAVLVNVAGSGEGGKRVAMALTDLGLSGDRLVAPDFTKQNLEAMPAFSGVR